MYISYDLEAWNDYEDLTKTLYRLNKQIYFKLVKLMKFISVQKKFESFGCHLLDFSVIPTGDTQKW
jgi:hypothetical protein